VGPPSRSHPHPGPRSESDAFAERWVHTVRRGCLDLTLVLGRRHLERALREYVAHYAYASAPLWFGGGHALLGVWMSESSPWLRTTHAR